MKKNKKYIKQTKKRAIKETDSTYFLKIVLYMILGTGWAHINTSSRSVPVPLGLVVGIFFASHEHFQIDRKIEYTVLLVVCFVAFWLPTGIFVSLG